jgi:hypothetical protein
MDVTSGSVGVQAFQQAPVQNRRSDEQQEAAVDTRVSSSLNSGVGSVRSAATDGRGQVLDISV